MNFFFHYRHIIFFEKIVLIGNDIGDGSSLPFKCDYCYKPLRNSTEVRKHIQKVHLDEKVQDIENDSKNSEGGHGEVKGEYECNICHKTLKTREGIIGHIFNVHEGERKCDWCSEKFKDLDQLRDHIKDNHESQHNKSKWHHKEAILKKSTFRTRQNSETKKTEKEKGQFQCQVCEKILTTQQGLKSHTKVFHSQTEQSKNSEILIGNMYHCEKCDFSSEKRLSLINHKNVKGHHGVKKCEICKESFKSSEKFENHKCLKKYRCKVCDKTFILNEMEDHIKSVHCDYKCDQCDYVCLTNAQLESHQNLKEYKTRNVLQCTMCKFKSCSPRGLKKHIERIHSKVYQCQKCDCSYKEMEHLRSHEKAASRTGMLFTIF